ncbi:hypothetical protein AC1031_007730 [Aphanomyces cochlioides]|nr:hypothetical protein AC1031_007730 [Aphanomyces cochlioides]
MPQVFVRVRGNVQKVMFRQTLIRAMIKRGIVGGASNNRQQKDLVDITFEGEEDAIGQLVQALKTTKPLNSWGAQVEKLEIRDSGISMEDHQVTTENVDNRSWNPNVVMYL